MGSNPFRNIPDVPTLRAEGRHLVVRGLFNTQFAVLEHETWRIGDHKPVYAINVRRK